MSYGFVYVLTNRAMPGVYKIGMTTGSPHARARDLSRPTGVPSAFEVVYYAECDHPEKIEKLVHQMLDGYRVNELREFFAVDLFQIIDCCAAVAEIFSEWIPEATRAIIDKSVSSSVVQ